MRYTWCDSCWADLLNKRMPPGLLKDVPSGTLVPFRPEPVSVPELSAVDGTRIEHKIMALGEHKSVATIAAPPATDTGSFSGYLAAFGEDLQGDSIMPGAMDQSVAAVNAGLIAWNLTDSHSSKASDIVATVTAAAIDRHGLRIEGQWGPGERAQALRQMVRNGQRIGLSIDYLATSSRPDGKGGRYLDKIEIVGGAVVVHPANPRALITEGKSGAWAPVVDVYDAAQADAERNDPERKAEDRLLASVPWPPPGLFDRQTSLALIRGAAGAKAARELAGDYERARAQARRDQANRYSSDLAEWMAAHR
jgi:HK97 family phage prohead protease